MVAGPWQSIEVCFVKQGEYKANADIICVLHETNASRDRKTSLVCLFVLYYFRMSRGHWLHVKESTR